MQNIKILGIPAQIEFNWKYGEWRVNIHSLALKLWAGDEVLAKSYKTAGAYEKPDSERLELLRKEVLKKAKAEIKKIRKN